MTVVGRSRIYVWLIAAVVFLAMAPTLRWMEFSGGSEDLNVGTVLEMRRNDQIVMDDAHPPREGPWIIPHLKGGPRTTKPPLTAWITATSVRPATIAALYDAAERARGYVELGWQARWPALLASCLLMIATFETALIVAPGDGRFALSAAAICAANILFQRFSRSATTDVYLAFFVTLANLFFAKAVFQVERRRLYAIAGGVAFGLALMSKGPPAFAQSTAPLALYWVWRLFESRRDPAKKPRLDWMAIGMATAVTLLIALPWPIYANMQHPGQFRFWYNETIEGGYAETFKPDPWWGYISTVGLMAPWAVILLWGIVLIACDMIDRRGEYAQGGMILALSVGSIVVMSFFKQKNERYMLPMVGPLAIVTAYGLLKSPPRFAKLFGVLMALQWGMIALAAIGGPMSFALVKKLATLDGRQWLTIQSAALWATALFTIVAIGWMWDRRRSMGIQISALLMMLILQLVFIHSYSRSSGGASEMKPLADTIWSVMPQYRTVRNYVRPGEPHKVPIDLYIYTNRVIRQIDDPSKLPRNVVLVSCTANPQTAAPIEGFRKIASVPRGKEFWEAFVREN